MMTATAACVVIGLGLCLAAVGGGGAGAQTLPRNVPGPGDPVVKHADAPIVIVQPVVDKAKGEVRVPGAFWNQHMTSWVEVAMCGRPSDFLHETIVCVTTTKALMMQALREAGCHDADEWVSSVHDFPKIRGDRLMILLEVTRAGKVETYSLDELLEYEGWGVSQGPYGWMFKGAPGENAQRKIETIETPEAAVADSDRTKIVRDDPQIALVLKGIQHFSQSFAEHPLAYDDWIYPMMRYGRNDKVLPPGVYDSNGDVAVQVVLKHITEESLITESARVWHDPAFAKYMQAQLPIARDVDREKAELWALLPEVKKLSAEGADAQKRTEAFGKAGVLGAKIEAGYATLDAAWAAWACDHPQLEAVDARDLAELKSETAQWKKHMALRKTRAEQLAIATTAAVDQAALKDPAKVAPLRGKEIAARSAAMLAENDEVAAYWKGEQARLDRKADPRADWITQIDTQVALADAKIAAGTSGQAYGKALQQQSPENLDALQHRYSADMARVTYERARLDLADVDFELSKREGFDDDPSLPVLKKRKAALKKSLKEAAAATQP